MLLSTVSLKPKKVVEKLKEKHDLLTKWSGITQNAERNGLQLFVAILIATILNVINPVSGALHGLAGWIAISTTLTQEANLGAVWKKCIFRLLGTVLGGHEGLAVMYLASLLEGGRWTDPHSAAKPTVYLIFMPTICAANQLLSNRLSKHSYLFVVANVTLTLVAFSGYRAPLTTTGAYFRMLTIGLGVLISAVCSAVIMPVTAKMQILDKGAKMYKTLGDLCDLALQQYVDVCNRPDSKENQMSREATRLMLEYSMNRTLNQSKSGKRRDGRLLSDAQLPCNRLSDTVKGAQGGLLRVIHAVSEAGQSTGGALQQGQTRLRDALARFAAGNPISSGIFRGADRLPPGPSAPLRLSTHDDTGECGMQVGDPGHGRHQSLPNAAYNGQGGQAKADEALGGQSAPPQDAWSRLGSGQHSSFFLADAPLPTPPGSPMNSPTGRTAPSIFTPTDPCDGPSTHHTRTPKPLPDANPPLTQEVVAAARRAALASGPSLNSMLPRQSGDSDGGGSVGGPRSTDSPTPGPPVSPHSTPVQLSLGHPGGVVWGQDSSHSLLATGRLEDACSELHESAPVSSFAGFSLGGGFEGPGEGMGLVLDRAQSLPTAPLSAQGSGAFSTPVGKDGMVTPQNTPLLYRIGESDNLSSATTTPRPPGLTFPRLVVTDSSATDSGLGGREGSLNREGSTPGKKKRVAFNVEGPGPTPFPPEQPQSFPQQAAREDSSSRMLPAGPSSDAATRAAPPAALSASDVRIDMSGGASGQTTPTPTPSDVALMERFSKISEKQAEVSSDMNGVITLLDSTKHELYLYGVPRMPEKEIRDWVKLIRRILGETIALIVPLEADRVSHSVVRPFGPALLLIGARLRALLAAMSSVFKGEVHPREMVGPLEDTEAAVEALLEQVASFEDIRIDTLEHLESLGVVLSAAANLSSLARVHFQSLASLYPLLHHPEASLEVIELQLVEALAHTGPGGHGHHRTPTADLHLHESQRGAMTRVSASIKERSDKATRPKPRGILRTADSYGSVPSLGMSRDASAGDVADLGAPNRDRDRRDPMASWGRPPAVPEDQEHVGLGDAVSYAFGGGGGGAMRKDSSGSNLRRSSGGTISWEGSVRINDSGGVPDRNGISHLLDGSQAAAAGSRAGGGGPPPRQASMPSGGASRDWDAEADGAASSSGGGGIIKSISGGFASFAKTVGTVGTGLVGSVGTGLANLRGEREEGTIAGAVHSGTSSPGGRVSRAESGGGLAPLRIGHGPASRLPVGGFGVGTSMDSGARTPMYQPRADDDDDGMSRMHLMPKNKLDAAMRKHIDSNRGF